MIPSAVPYSWCPVPRPSPHRTRSPDRCACQDDVRPFRARRGASSTGSARSLPKSSPTASSSVRERVHPPGADQRRLRPGSGAEPQQLRHSDPRNGHLTDIASSPAETARMARSLRSESREAGTPEPGASPSLMRDLHGRPVGVSSLSRDDVGQIDPRRSPTASGSEAARTAQDHG
jgi:hypothetical protein